MNSDMITLMKRNKLLISVIIEKPFNERVLVSSMNTKELIDMELLMDKSN